ncbi:MAG: hypothetical protein WKF41_18320 [Gaiellaceae bacterium]
MTPELGSCDVRWLELSIFYAQGPRRGDDDDRVQQVAVPLYGVGRLVPEAIAGRRVRDQRLATGVRLLRLRSPWREATRFLEAPCWDKKYGSGQQVERFLFGYLRRPPVLGSMDHVNRLMLSPSTDLGLVHHFVMANKVAGLDALHPGDRRLRERREVHGTLLDEVGALVGRDLRGRDLALVGDLFVVEEGPSRPPLDYETVPAEAGKPSTAVQFTVRPTGSVSLPRSRGQSDYAALCFDLESESPIDWSFSSNSMGLM